MGSAEGGAEFVHGELPLTLHLAKEAGIPVHPVRSDMHQVRKGKWGKEGFMTNEWDQLMNRMETLPEDTKAYAYLEIPSGADEQALTTRADVELTWLHRNGPAQPASPALIAALAVFEAPPGDGHSACARIPSQTTTPAGSASLRATCRAASSG